MNAGLQRTDGELVAIFDADHVTEADFLVEGLHHLVDTRVAFVQSPQWYTNRDRLVSLGASESQRIFYELICPGKNHFNAAFCVGTNVIFRRTAIDDIGGMHTDSKSEDVWPSYELHQAGWRSVYIPVTLAIGDAPETIEFFLFQAIAS